MVEPAAQADWSLTETVLFGLLGGAGLAVAGWLGTAGTPIWLVPAAMTAVVCRGRWRHLPIVWLLLVAGAVLPLLARSPAAALGPAAVRAVDLALMLLLMTRLARRPGALTLVLGAACSRTALEQGERWSGLGEGFLWGSHQLDWTAFSQFAHVGGVSGLSFLIVFVAAAAGIVAFDTSRDGRLRCVALAMTLLVLVEAAGLARVTRQGTSTVRVAAVWSAQRTPRRLYELTEQASAESPALVVWPRDSVSLSADERALLLTQLWSLARANNLWLVGGAFDTATRLSAVLTVSPQGHVELLPDTRPWLPPLAARFGGLGVILGDRLAQQGRWPVTSLTHAAVLAAPAAGDTGAVDPVVTARLRAVEEAVVVVRATAEGTSALIDPYGRVVASATAAEEPDLSLVSDVPVEHGGAGVAAVRRLFPWLCLVCLLILLAVAGRPGRPAMV